MVGPGKTFNLPLSMVLRMGYGFGEEFGAVGEESLCRHSIYSGQILSKQKLASY